MNEINDKDKYTDDFVVDIEGEGTGERYQGKFKVRTRFSFRDHLARDQVRAALLGQDPKTAYLRATSLSEMLAELQMRIIDAPTWWKNSDGGVTLADDDNLIIDMHTKAMKAEADLKAKVGKKGETAKSELRTDAKASAPA